MAKRRAKQEGKKRETPDFMEIGKEVVPGMRLRCICRGHQGTIGRIAWSPCGRFIASPSQDKTIRIWDANDGKCLAVLNRSESAIHSVAWSVDSERVVSIESGKNPMIWDVRTRLSTDLEVYDGGIRSISWAPRDELIVGLSGTGQMVIWNTNHRTIEAKIHVAPSKASPVWNPDATCLATGSTYDRAVRIWDGKEFNRRDTLTGHTAWPKTITWSHDGRLVAAAADDGVVRIWDANTKSQLHVLEFHTSAVDSLSFFFDDRLLLSASDDQRCQVWSARSWTPLLNQGNDSDGFRTAIASFSPREAVIATLDEACRVIQIWDVNEDAFLRKPAGDTSPTYTSAKIVLVGESNVGKSCLAMRLAEDRYPKDHEHGTTHGMRFWPMEAEALHAAAKPPEGQRRDVVLWDFGGQDEYQLVHQMFLHDTTLALVLIDPTRGRAALDEARDWNKQLEKHLGKDKAVKLLVGAKVDRKSKLIDLNAIEALKEECGFAAFLDLSAKTGRNTKKLRKAIAEALDWEGMAKTSRPELFQRIRDDIEKRRKKKEVVLTLEAFKRAIKKSAAKLYEEAAVEAVTDQLATQGVIVRTKLTGGDDAIVLQLPVIERYAGSLIVAARDNPRGVPALETSELGSPSISLPGMAAEERVPRRQERIVLEAVAELMIEHGLCFRHEGLLVFPSLLKATETARADELPGSVSLYYDFSGAIDNVYASLISWLVIGQGFGRIRLWENRVEFAVEGQGACGLRKVKRGGGFAHLDVYFHDGTPTRTQTEFVSFVHQHLRGAGIDVVEHFELICAKADCRYEFSRDVVQNRMVRRETDVVCPQCETRIKLSEGFQHEPERDEKAEQKSFALMTRVREDVPKIVASVKERAFGRTDDQYRTDRPIRILHLSDLHFTSDTVPGTKLQWLIDDIRKGKWLAGSDDGGELDYVVISGDMTHQGSGPGFVKASKFVSLLVERFGLSAERFVFVPGNHDVQDLDEAYDWRMNVTDDEERRAVKEGRLFGLRSDKYDQRLTAFSDQFYHPLLQKPYPLDPGRQGVATIFPETKLQFLTLNSCWEIDQFHRTRASVHPDAVARLIAEADRQIEQAIVNTDVKPEDYLRIGVWHHPVTHPERAVGNPEFLDHLMNRDVKICLTGDIHEMNRDVVRHWHASRMHVLGAGSFGARGGDLSEGSPRLYNLLEIDREFRSIRVHTRQQPKPNGAWKGWNEWPMPDDAEGGLAYFDISLE